MKRALLALSLLGLLAGQARAETVLERAARSMHAPAGQGASSQVNINYTFVFPDRYPGPAYPCYWPPPQVYAYPYPAYPPPYPAAGSYWYAQVPLTPGLGAQSDAYPSAVYIFPSFRSAWAYGPTFIPSPQQPLPWYGARALPRREEGAEQGSQPAQPTPGEGGQKQEPAKPTVVQASRESGEDIIFLPRKALALETSPPHPALAIEALGSSRVKVTWSSEGDSELRSVEVALVSPEGQVLDSTSFAKPPYSATLRGDWHQVRLRLALRFESGGAAEFVLPLKEKETELEQASP
jgi:hypothetical protein